MTKYIIGQYRRWKLLPAPCLLLTCSLPTPCVFLRYRQGENREIVRRKYGVGRAVALSEVAYSLGFQYPQHFTRLFKKATGMTPSEYRQAEV